VLLKLSRYGARIKLPCIGEHCALIKGYRQDQLQTSNIYGEGKQMWKTFVI